jgi:hypothetical protein
LVLGLLFLSGYVVLGKLYWLRCAVSRNCDRDSLLHRGPGGRVGLTK